MDDSQTTPEELIRGMTPDEICELLEEMGVQVSHAQAVAIQGLINRLGSLEAAFAALDTDTQPRRSIA
jgi:hypothetical protein